MKMLQDNNGRGIAYMLAAIAMLSSSDAATKWLAPHYSVVQIFFLRAVIGLLPSVAFTLIDNGKAGLLPRSISLHLGRTALMLTAWGFFIVAIRDLPLADTYTIVFGAPLFMTLFGRVVLRERVSRERWIAVCLGFGGVLIVFHPSGVGLGPAVLFAVAASIAWACSTIVSRKLGQVERSSTILFYYMLLCFTATAPFVSRHWTPVEIEHYGAFFLMGIIGCIGHWLLAQAFRYGEVSLLAPFEYSGMVWAIIIGYWFWADVPTPVMLLGASIIIGSGLYMAKQESKLLRTASRMETDDGALIEKA